MTMKTQYILEMVVGAATLQFTGPYHSEFAAIKAQAQWLAELIAQKRGTAHVLVHVLHRPEEPGEL